MITRTVCKRTIETAAPTSVPRWIVSDAIFRHLPHGFQIVHDLLKCQETTRARCLRQVWDRENSIGR